jgi:hypothetical protein
MLVGFLDGGEVAEQLADGSVRAAGRGLAIEVAAFELHLLGGAAHGFDADGGQVPHRLAAREALHVLASYQRDMGAEFFGVEIDQAAAMLVLLGRHVGKDHRAVGVGVAQAFGEVGIDAAILLLRADRQGQDLAFAEFGQFTHHR